MLTIVRSILVIDFAAGRIDIDQNNRRSGCVLNNPPTYYIMSRNDTLHQGLIVIIGDNAYPRRDIAYGYLKNITAERKIIYCIDPLTKQDGFWKNKLDNRFIFDHWAERIGEGILKIQAHDVECALVVHNYIDMKSDVFNALVDAAVLHKILLIITILDRGQIFPQALLERADEVIYTNGMQN